MAKENFFQSSKKLLHTCFDHITRRHAETYHRPCGCTRACQFEFSADTTALSTGPNTNKQARSLSVYCAGYAGGIQVECSLEQRTDLFKVKVIIMTSEELCSNTAMCRRAFNTQRYSDDWKPLTSC